MRVAVLSPAAELGGAERSLLTFLKAAHGGALEALVFLPRSGPLGDSLSSLGIPWQVVPMPRALLSQSRQNLGELIFPALKLIFQGPGYLSRLATAIRHYNPDVLYTNGIKVHIIGAFLRPWLQAGVVWHLRDNWGGPLIGRLADLGPSQIIANSRSTAMVLQKHMEKPEKVSVIHNAVDIVEFSPDGEIAPVDGRGNPKIGLVAAFARWKGHTLLLRVAERILSQFPSTVFYFIGGSIYDTVAESGYEVELRQLIKQRGLSDSIILTGFQAKIAPWYRAMDIVVNASIRPEPFGRTLLEAMACGKAVVGPRAGGIPEFVRHGENGLLYEMGNANGLAEGVLTLMRTPALGRRLGAAGRETAVEQFAPEPHADSIYQVLSLASKKLHKQIL
jgi:glycosyltransferase involved in cell wall biosynthesis